MDIAPLFCARRAHQFHIVLSMACLPFLFILIPSLLFSFNMAPGLRGLLPAAQGSNPICSAAPNILTWTTASEVNTVGFNLYRAESSSGPYTKINSSLVPTSRGSLTGAQYEFRDADVTPGNTYYYQLEDVDSDGRATRHGPILIKARAAVWICDNPAAWLALATGILAAIVLGIYFARRKGLAPRLAAE